MSAGEREVNIGQEFFEQLGKGYALAAESSIHLLESVTMGQWENTCKSRFDGISLKQFPFLIGEIEPSYDPVLIASRITLNRSVSMSRRENKITGFAQDKREETSAINLFGGGAYAYLEVSKMMMRWYNFGELETGLTNNSGYSVAFSRFLDSARDRAIAKANLAREICGAVPESILINLHLGDQLRYGDTSNKLACFVAFWKSSLYSDLVVSAAQADENNLNKTTTK